MELMMDGDDYPIPEVDMTIGKFDFGEFPHNLANELDNIMYLIAAAVLIYMAWRIQDKNLSTMLGALIGVCINKVRGEVAKK